MNIVILAKRRGGAGGGDADANAFNTAVGTLTEVQESAITTLVATYLSDKIG